MNGAYNMADDQLIGKNLNNYRIDRLLGRGGMASVYYGWDKQLERPAAIKVLDPVEQAHPGYAKRLVQEARAIARWRHENIMQVYYAGTSKGYSYFAMEYIEGEDLSDLLNDYARQGELMPQADVLRIGWAVARALDYAHRHGIIHRDVKPSNVLVSKDGRIVLADFGLALDIQEGTQGEVFGSPHYIAPEQAVSSSAAVPQSDLYSLGIMLYEMLTGRVPFDDPSPLTLAVQHISQPLPMPTTLNPSLSVATEAVLIRALSKEPEDRFQSGADLMNALEPTLTESRIKITGRFEFKPKMTLSKTTINEHVAQHIASRPTPTVIGVPELRTAVKPPRAKSALAKPSPKLAPRQKSKKIAAGKQTVKPKNSVKVKSKSSKSAKPKLVRPQGAKGQQSISIFPVIAILLIVGIGTVGIARPDILRSAAATVRQNIPTKLPIMPVLKIPTAKPIPTNVQPSVVPPPVPYDVIFYYSESGFYMWNHGDRDVEVTPLVFEALDKSGSPTMYRFEASEWAELYPTVQPRHCDALEIQREAAPERPTNCIEFNAVRSRMTSSELLFWLPREGISQFRVVWNGEEVARCKLSEGICNVTLPLSGE